MIDVLPEVADEFPNCPLMTQRLVSLQRRLEMLHAESRDLLMETTASIKNDELDPKDMSDLGYTMKRIATLHDEMRKDANAHEKVCSKLLCTKIVRMSTDALETVRGHFSTATARIITHPVMPEKGTPAWDRLCESLGITGDAKSVVSLSWNRLGEWATNLAEEGKPLPEVFTSKYEEPGITYRRRTQSAKG